MKNLYANFRIEKVKQLTITLHFDSAHQFTSML